MLAQQHQPLGHKIDSVFFGDSKPQIPIFSTNKSRIKCANFTEDACTQQHGTGTAGDLVGAAQPFGNMAPHGRIELVAEVR